MIRDAVFSPCGTWRYALLRRWAPGPTLLVIGHNPSVADADKEDPTSTRVINFAKRDGFGAVVMENAFAYVATDPKDLADKPKDVICGPDNWIVLRDSLRVADGVLCAWGAMNKRLWGMTSLQDWEVMALLKQSDPRCLGTTKHGWPRHPLYVKGDQPAVRYAI